MPAVEVELTQVQAEEPSGQRAVTSPTNATNPKKGGVEALLTARLLASKTGASHRSHDLLQYTNSSMGVAFAARGLS